MQRGHKKRLPVILAVMGGSLWLTGCGHNAPSAAPAPTTVSRTMTILTGKMDGKPGWPKYTPADWTAPVGAKVALTIVSYDDGPSPLPSGSPFATVQGTTSGTEWVDGKPVSHVSPQEVAHTFTIPAMHLNLVIPAAPPGGKVTVKATFNMPAHAGQYGWHCEAPCGTGPDGMGGPMMTPGWMEGTISAR